MKIRRRNFAIAAGSALLLFALFLSSDDSAPRTEDPLSDDTALSLEVLSAHGDSLIPMEKPVETTLAERVGEPLPAEPVADTGHKPIPPSMSPVVVSAGTLARVQEPRRHSPAPTPDVRAPDGRLTVVDRADVVPVSMNTSRIASAPARNEGSRRMGIISAGAELSVVADKRICLGGAGVGDTFPAVVANPVAGSSGLVIPRGARAVAEIVSRGEWGAGLGVRIKSVRFDGRAHPVTSDVGYVTAERSRESGDVCIPRRGRIDTSLKRPLRAAVSSPDA